MGQEIVLPDFARQKPSAAFAALKGQDDSLSDGIGQSYPVIGYKGKNWSFRYRGQRKNFIRPDDGTQAAHLDVIILGQARQKSKSYYKKFNPNAEGERPICASINGVTPDADVMQKQCDTCVLCPRNDWKTDENGKKGRDCADYKRLAVLVLPKQTAALYDGQAVVEPAFLRVPAASLNSLAIMGTSMDAQGYHYSMYVTRITFDPAEAHPKMIFQAIDAVPDADAPGILAMRDDMQVDRIINGGFVEGPRTISQEARTSLPPAQSLGLGSIGVGQQARPQTDNVLELSANRPSTAAQSVAPPTSGSTQGSASSILGSARPATPAPALEASTGPSVRQISSGDDERIASGGAMPATAPGPTLDLTANTTLSDTGASEDADDDLDAMIAKEVAKNKK